MDDQEKKGKSSLPVEKLHILWAVCGMLTLAVLMVWIVLSDGNADPDTADKSAETEAVALEEGDLQSVEAVEAGDIPSVESEASNGRTLPFFSVNFEEEGAEIAAFREFLEGKRAAVVEPEFHGYHFFSDYQLQGEEIIWQLRVGGEATLAELLEAYFAEEDNGADEILYALTDIGGDGRRELYVRAQGDKSWGYAQLVMAFYYIGDDLHLSFAEEEGGRSSLTVTAKGYVQSSGSTGAENISGEAGRMGADGSYEEWYHFEAGTGAGVHDLLEDWDAYRQIFLGENNSLEEDPPMEVWLYTIDGQQYYEYSLYEEATQAQRDKCQEYLALCEASQGITFTPQEELDAILRKRQEALGITDDMVGNGLEYPDPIDWRNGFSYVFRGTQEWQQAYYEVLCEARRQNVMMEEQDWLPFRGYYLYDIDKDGIPELLLKQGTCEADYWADIYTWRNGETICLGGIGMGHTSLYTWEGENALLSYWGHMGGAFATKISIDGDELLWDEFFQEGITGPVAQYTNPTELVPGCVCLAEYRINLDLPLVSYEIVMGTADAAVKNPAVISKEEVQEILLDVIENNGMVYGVTGDGFGGDTGYVSFEEYCAPESAKKYAKTPLQVDKYVEVDVNGDGQIEMVLDLREDESQKEKNGFCEEIRVILSLQGEVVYAYCLNYENSYLVLEDGAFYVSYGDGYEFTIRYLFDRDECFEYYVADVTDVSQTDTNWFLDHVTGIDCYTVTQEEIDRIGQMDDLLYLSLLINDETIDLTPLSNLGYLKRLEMSFFTDGLDMTFLNGLSSLQYLYIEGCDSIEDLTFLRHMPALQEVIIKNVADVDLGCFEENRFLKSIHIVGGNIRNMEGLSELKQLRSIWLVENTLDRDQRQILNLDITGDLICLEDMRLESIKVDNLSPLARLDRLSYIYLKDTGIGDIEPLGRVRNLEEVSIYETESEQIEKQASIYLKHVANITVE